MVRPPETRLLTEANAAAQFAKKDVIDASDYPSLQAALDDAAGKTVFVKAGVWPITATLTMGRTTSLRLDPGATVKAVAPIAGPMLKIGEMSAWWEDQELVGGEWDCNNLADDAIEMVCGLHSRLADFTWMNPKRHGVILGTMGSTFNTHEMTLSSLKGNRTLASAAPVGSMGVWMRRAYDSTLFDCVIVGPERSFRNDSNGNTFIACHAYGLGYNQYPKAVFSDNGSDNNYMGCYADTPLMYGWEITANSYRCKIDGGMVYINPEGPDNSVIGVHTELAYPNDLKIENVTFIGSPGHRLKTDYDGAFPSFNVASSRNVPGNSGRDFNVVAPVLADQLQDVRVARTLAYGPAPTVQLAAGLGTTPPPMVLDGNSTDFRGRVTFGTGTAPAAGILCYVTFNRPYSIPPIVTIAARNYASAAVGLYVRDVTATSFSIASTGTPAASMPNTTYAFDFAVSG